MNGYNSGAFYVGLFLFAVTSCHNLIAVLLCARFEVGITKYALLGDPWGKSLWRRQAAGVKVVMGLLPVGGNVGFWYDAFSDNPSPFSLNSKPNWQRRTILATGVWSLLLILFSSLFFVQSAGGWWAALQDTAGFFANLYKALFSAEARHAFTAAAPGYFAHKQWLPALISLCCLQLLIHALLQLASEWPAANKTPKWVEYTMILVALFFCWLFLWKLPVLICSFFTVAQIVSAILSCMLGIYTAAGLAYFPLVYLLGRWYKQPG